MFSGFIARELWGRCLSCCLDILPVSDFKILEIQSISATHQKSGIIKTSDFIWKSARIRALGRFKGLDYCVKPLPKVGTEYAPAKRINFTGLTFPRSCTMFPRSRVWAEVQGGLDIWLENETSLPGCMRRIGLERTQDTRLDFWGLICRNCGYSGRLGECGFAIPCEYLIVALTNS